VYKVEVFRNNKTTDVYVDAGNGKVLTSIFDKNDQEVENDNGYDNENRDDNND